MPVLRQVVQYAYAPLMMLGIPAAAYWIMVSGHSYFWQIGRAHV